jgi:hypothetical protein
MNKTNTIARKSGGDGRKDTDNTESRSARYTVMNPVLVFVAIGYFLPYVGAS